MRASGTEVVGQWASVTFTLDALFLEDGQCRACDFVSDAAASLQMRDVARGPRGQRLPSHASGVRSPLTDPFPLFFRNPGFQ